MVNSKPTESTKTDSTQAAPPTNHATVISRHPKFCFDSILVAIQIETTLFNIHKYQLMKSNTFSDMFAIADELENKEAPREGSSLDHPIVMQGVSAADFECLMTVLYTSHFSAHQPEPEASLIVPAFRLANMWDFTELCGYLQPLAEKVLDDVDKIVFARKFKVDEWIVLAHVKLCLREEKITTQEAKKLGMDSLLFISRFREEYQKSVDGVTAHFANCHRMSCRCENTLTIVAKPMPGEDKVKQSVQKWLDRGCVFSNHWNFV
ncbi:hypothetical protein FRC12_006368 [Ceratobasidium sp. 428]|nr:hypothetical protein FRC12_006368 [Ceratobasidium sp. 428]